MRKPKYSMKQMRYFASISKSKNALKWQRKIYTRIIKTAESKGEFGRAMYYRSLRGDLSKTFKHKKYPLARQTWKIATEQDIAELAMVGQYSKDNTKLLILDENNKAILIAYEGTEIFEEIVDSKKKLFNILSK